MRVGTGNGRARSGIFTALAGALVATIAVTAFAAEAVAQTQAQRLKLLEQTVKELLARDEARERKMKAMEAELKRLRRGRGLATVAPKDKPAMDDHGHDHAKKPDADKEEMAGRKKDEHEHDHGEEPGEDAAGHDDEHAADVWSARVGDGVLRLKRLGLDVDFAMGASTAKGEEMEAVFGGHHDPQRTGFTLQGVDLSAAGSYDPYFDAFFNVNFTVDGGGETAIELEEAWVRSKWLRGGVRLQAGHFYAPLRHRQPDAYSRLGLADPADRRDAGIRRGRRPRAGRPVRGPAVQQRRVAQFPACGHAEPAQHPPPRARRGRGGGSSSYARRYDR